MPPRDRRGAHEPHVAGRHPARCLGGGAHLPGPPPRDPDGLRELGPGPPLSSESERAPGVWGPERELREGGLASPACCITLRVIAQRCWPHHLARESWHCRCARERAAPRVSRQAAPEGRKRRPPSQVGMRRRAHKRSEAAPGSHERPGSRCGLAASRRSPCSPST